MAVAGYRSSSITMKAVVLPVMLVLLCMAVAVAPSFAAAPATTSEASMGRRLLAIINLCGPGSPPVYNCTKILPQANKPLCCPNALGLTQSCSDVGGFLINRCGSCNTTCSFGQVCCRGVCSNLLADSKNCGVCGRVCQPCTLGLCSYGF